MSFWIKGSSIGLWLSTCSKKQILFLHLVGIMVFSFFAYFFLFASSIAIISQEKIVLADLYKKQETLHQTIAQQIALQKNYTELKKKSAAIQTTRDNFTIDTFLNFAKKEHLDCIKFTHSDTENTWLIFHGSFNNFVIFFEKIAKNNMPFIVKEIALSPIENQLLEITLIIELEQA